MRACTSNCHAGNSQSIAYWGRKWRHVEGQSDLLEALPCTDFLVGSTVYVDDVIRVSSPASCHLVGSRAARKCTIVSNFQSELIILWKSEHAQHKLLCEAHLLVLYNLWLEEQIVTAAFVIISGFNCHTASNKHTFIYIAAWGSNLETYWWQKDAAQELNCCHFMEISPHISVIKL